MNAGLGWCTLAMLGLVACTAKSSGETSVTNDPAAMRSSPAGVATLGFLDLESSIPADALPTAVPLPPQGDAIGLVSKSTLPNCIQSSILANVVTYSFTGCTAASTGVLNGTVAVTVTIPSVGTTVCTEVFNLVSTLTATQSWHYTGTQTVTIVGSTATVTDVPLTAIQAAFTDTVTPANDRTYIFKPALTMNWAVAGNLVLDGSYTFTRVGAETITVTLAPVIASVPSDPLTWVTGCSYPTAGTLAIDLTGSLGGNASTTAVFGPTCAQMTLGGGAILLGQ